MPTSNPFNTAPATVLIIDDSPVIHTILKSLFEDTYRIEHAFDGVEGLLKITELSSNICAILLDVMMPRMSGIDVLKKLHALGISHQIPIFLITAESSSSITQNAYDLGVMDVINKPFVPYVVKRRVNSVIELFQTKKQLRHVISLQTDKLESQSRTIVDLNYGIVECLATAIEFRSVMSGEHVRRIHDITYYLLRHTVLCEGVSQSEIDAISMAAIMHDVGKIAIPDSILNKPGKLTTEEFEIMKSHTIKGYELLESIPQMHRLQAYPYALDITRHHHERWDGNGYPDGLKGDEISIWAQIVALADVYDALISKRVYKEALDSRTAVEMIIDGQCGVFNPDLLKCFLEAVPEINKLYLPAPHAVTKHKM